MPKKPDIVREEQIVVASRELNDYGTLIVTTAEGKEVKIGKGRAHLHPLFEDGNMVMVKYATGDYGEYVADAELVVDAEGKKLSPVKPTAEAPKSTTPKATDAPKPKSPDDERLRSVAASYAKDLACAKLIGIEDMGRWADRFIRYIRGDK